MSVSFARGIIAQEVKIEKGKGDVKACEIAVLERCGKVDNPNNCPKIWEEKIHTLFSDKTEKKLWICG